MATKKIVPRANGEGAIGDNTTGIEKYWGGVYTNVLNSANAIELAAFNDGLQLKRSASYVAGQVRFVSGLQAGLYLEATVDGITDSTDITIPSTVIPNTTTIMDGTVTWIVRQLANTGNLSQAGERQKSTAYDVSNMASFPTLPYGWYLECTTDGMTSASNLVITSPSIGNTVTDGTVVWTIRSVSAEATTTNKGLLSPADKLKIDNIPASGGTGFNHRAVITTSGTWTVPTSGYYKVTCIGGGGAGGNGGTGKGGKAGSRGGSTSFGSYLTASGGHSGGGGGEYGSGGGGAAGDVAVAYLSLNAGSSVTVTIGAGGTAPSSGDSGSTTGESGSGGAAGGSAFLGGQGAISAYGSGNSGCLYYVAASSSWYGSVPSGTGGSNGTEYGGGGGGGNSNHSNYNPSFSASGGGNGSAGATITTNESTYPQGGAGGNGAIIIEYYSV